MFYNLKLNGKKIIIIIFLIIFIIMFLIIGFGIYNLFFKEDKNPTFNEIVTLDDSIMSNSVFEITPENYTTILQTVTDNLDNYIGLKIHFTGYVYRLLDFEENQFVLARNMKVNPNSNQTLVVGFLCFYDKANNFDDSTWVDVTGEIVKGDYYGDIPEIKVLEMFECDIPEQKTVLPPDNTYIPTSNMF